LAAMFIICLFMPGFQPLYVYSNTKDFLGQSFSPHGHLCLAPSFPFANLIEKSCDKTGEKVAVIIDEYDKPMLGTIDEPELHIKIREELKGFYGVLKSYDEYLRFVFLTGVTKFSHVSVFSDLNHLTDLTLDPDYADICGITQKELETCFALEIESVSKETGKN